MEIDFIRHSKSAQQFKIVAIKPDAVLRTFNDLATGVPQRERLAVSE
jgi:hypothetical protein